MTTRTRTAASTVALVVVAAVICVGAYLGIWWITKDSTNRRAEINQNSYQRQNALVEQILDDIDEASDPAIVPAQQLALIDIICDSVDKLTGSIALPSHALTFVAQECP